MPRADVNMRPNVDPLEVLTARAWARAHLVSTGDFDLHEAVDVLQEFAVDSGLVEQIGQDAVQDVIAAAFGDRDA